MEIEEQAWADTYKPIQNPLDETASLGGIMFETYGVELNYILHAPKENVWTYVDGDGGVYIINGYHLCNRIGYIVTEVPWLQDVTVVIDEWDDLIYCEECNEDIPETMYEANLGYCNNCKDRK